MRKLTGRTSMAILSLMFYASVGVADEHDPVREAQRRHDCIAENVAKQDGRSQAAIEASCDKAIADGTYKDPNISLDGMIKSPTPQ